MTATAKSKPAALIVEDDPGFRESLAFLVAREGYEVREADSLESARRAMAESSIDVVLVDQGLPDGDGLELLHDDEVRGEGEFVVITGNATVESAVASLREGALDYLTKPLDRARLKSILANVARTRALKREVSSLRGELRQLGRFERLVGRSSAMQKTYDLIGRVARTKASVLLIGESGTGKELAAETIHALSDRRDRPFLAVNCGAVANTLIESELFGHEKGSFTGADRERRGYFEQAAGGTLFLDEITEMPAELQVKFLRVLESGTVMRVGASQGSRVDVRMIAASNRDPLKAMHDGQLREDLYYRLSVFPVVLPPLRERGQDIDLLSDHFLESINAREGTEKKLTIEARRALRAHAWPGNVRELKNAIERAAILAEAEIGPDLFPDLGGRASVAPQAGGSSLEIHVGISIEEAERKLVLATLDQTHGDKKRTAEILGISLKTLYNRLNLYEAAGHLSAHGDPT